MGRWENRSMDVCYGCTLPINAMCTMIGFPATIRNYKIHRDIPVPDLFEKLYSKTYEDSWQNTETNFMGDVMDASVFLKNLLCTVC